MLLLVLWIAAHDVTSAESRQQNLLQYVAARDDLSTSDKQAFEKSLRLIFGGKAFKPGTDEAVTTAKSVISAGIFHQYAIVAVVQAAYDAHNDVLSWVPPPLAIRYQLMKLEGRPPKEGVRLIATHFPRYFDEELAPEYAHWWAEQIERNTVNPHMRVTVERQLAETRVLMRPMLAERLYRLSEWQARLERNDDAGLRAEVAALTLEIAQDYRGVEPSAPSLSASAYERYVALTKAMGKMPKAAPREKANIAPKPPSQVTVTPPSNRTMRGAPVAGDPLLVFADDDDNRIDASTHAWEGTPYLFGGTDKRGIDCSGFVREVFRDAVAVELPRQSAMQATTGERVDEAKLAIGDLVFFDTLERGRITHVGVYLGDHIFAHASSSRGVVRDKLNAAWAQRAYRVGRRLFER